MDFPTKPASHPNRPYPHKVMTIIGTRPEAIKMAPVVQRLQADPRFHSVLCATGQHMGLLEQALGAFGLSTDVNLKVMKPGQTLADLTASILSGLRPVLDDEQPDQILVHGDTTTTLAASMAGFYAKIPVGHVEAGLRSYDMNSPWPEEANRKMVTTLATDHFAPTENARRTLMAEGVSPEQITVTGNTVIDALMIARSKLGSDAGLRKQMQTRFGFLDARRRVLLVTMHRRENHGRGIENICGALRNLRAAFSDLQIVMPMHRNPAVSGPVGKMLADHLDIHLIAPQDYLPFVYLMTLADIILTDSGGIQEEAPSLGVPVLVARNSTERTEAVTAGTVALTGTNAARIYADVARLLTDADAYSTMSRALNPYGDGQASRRIANYLSKDLECKELEQSRSLGWAI